MLELPNDSWFILGCQRSGTTLLRLVLNSHEDLRCIDETLGHEILAGRVDVPTGRRRLGFKLPRFTEQIDSAQPSDYFVYPARRFYSGQPIIFIQRDPRDVIASMLRLNDGAWFQRWVRAILDEKLKNEEFCERYAAMREWCERSARPDAAVGALYWRYKNDALEIYRQRGYPVHLVRYEDLVSFPERELRKISEFLTVEWQPARLLAHFTIEHDQLMDDGKAIGGTDPRRPIDSASLGLWTGVLDAPSVEIIEHVAYCALT